MAKYPDIDISVSCPSITSLSSLTLGTRQGMTMKLSTHTNGVRIALLCQIFLGLIIFPECAKCDKMYVIFFFWLTSAEYPFSYGRFSKSIKPDECGV